LGDDGLTALSTGLRMLTILDISNRMSDLGNCKAGPKGLIALTSNLSQLKYLEMGKCVQRL
jgi:hypothetical protein